MKSPIAHRVQNFTSSEIMGFFGKAKELENPVDLSIGIPYGEMTKEAKDAAIAALNAGKTKYTPAGGLPELRVALAEKLRDRNGIDADAATTIVTSGVSGGLFLAMGAVLDPGDEIIIPDPFFLAYRELAALLEAKAVFLDTYPDFKLDTEKLRGLITPRTKAVLINSPNNPTGEVYNRTSLEALAEICREHDLVVISDEVYEDFVFGSEHVSIGAFYQPTITLNGFSKTHAMTGLRIGYAHSTPEIIKAMTELEQFVFFSNSSIAEHAALGALDVTMTDTMAHYTENRNYVREHLDPRYERSSGEGSFFFFLKHPAMAGRELTQAAFEEGLIVIPGDLFSLRESHIRISYAVSHKTLSDGVAILNKLI